SNPAERLATTPVSPAAPVPPTPTSVWEEQTEAAAIGIVAPRRRRRNPVVLVGILASMAALVLGDVLGISPSGKERDSAGARPRLGMEKTVVNSVGMKLVYIQPGKFTMGSDPVALDRARKAGKLNAELPENPTHEVRITSGFYIGAYKVTQRQYEKVIGNN